MTDRPDMGPARAAMNRAVRRLGVLELLLLLVAAVGALAAGALAALLLRESLGLPFRPVWWVSSLVFFLVPGTLAFARARRGEATRDEETSE